MAYRYVKSDATEDVSQAGPLRAIIYCRQSKNMTGEGEGVENQERLCREHCDRRGHQVVALFNEKDPDLDDGEHRSGHTASATNRKKKRRDYLESLRMVRDGEADVIVSYNSDRLTRTPLEIEELIELWGTHGLLIELLSGDVRLDSDDGRMFARMLGARARAEIERKAARRLTLDIARAKKGKPAPWRAYGYDKAGAVVESEAAIVREIFDSLLSGVGVQTIARSLSRRGIRNTRGTAFSNHGIRQLAANPRYIAERWMAYSDRPGSSIPSRQHYIGPGDWEPLVTLDVFRAVGLLLNHPDRRPRESTARKWLGSGLYLCGECGASMKVTYRVQPAIGDRPERRRRAYVCRANPNHNGQPADAVDSAVLTAITAYIETADLASIGATDKQQERVAVLRAEEATLNQRRGKLKKSLAAGVLEPEDYAEAKDLINAEIVRVNAEIMSLANNQILMPLIRSVAPVEFFLNRDVAGQQDIIRALCPDGIVLVKRPPYTRGFKPEYVRIGLPGVQRMNNSAERVNF